MCHDDPFSAFPVRIPLGKERSHLVFERVPDYFAVHGSLPDALRRTVVFQLEADQITVCRGSPSEIVMDQDIKITPVFRLAPSGPLSVPTGNILVRFADDIMAKGQGDRIQESGYHLVETLPYAPNAAWVVSTDGDISTALLGISRLEELAGVVNVEPQMVTRRARR